MMQLIDSSSFIHPGQMYLCVLFPCCQVDLDFKDVCFFGFLFLFFCVLTGMAANLSYYG